MNRLIPALDKIIQFSLLTFVICSLFSISITQISFGIGSITWLLKTHLTKTWGEIRGTRVGIAILAFCLAYFISLTTAVDLESGINYMKKLLQLIIFFWIANTVQEGKQRNLLVSLVIFAGVASALNGIYMEIVNEFPGSIKVSGTMSTASTFASLIMLIGLVASGKFLFDEPKNFWVLGGVGIISLCLLMVFARQAWLGFLVGNIFLVFFWNKKFLWVIPLVLVFIFLLIPQDYKDRIGIIDIKNDRTFNIRQYVWKGGWQIFKDYPITGCGFKCVDSVYSKYPDPTGFVEKQRGMHSNIMQLLIDTGIVGFGAWLSIWVAYFIEVFKRYQVLAKDKTQNNKKGLLLGSLAAVLGFLVGGLFESSFYDSEVIMLLYFIMGISLAKVKNVPKVS
tara:strand:- start:342 stop:1523 length:1182 start_codon:yes stop_codon:yes gene_type:complete